MDKQIHIVKKNSSSAVIENTHSHKPPRHHTIIILAYKPLKNVIIERMEKMKIATCFAKKKKNPNTVKIS